MKLATLIGDVVGSRSHEDRRSLQDALRRGFSRINAYTEPLQPLAPTVGDEFQAAFTGVADAVAASLLIRLCLVDEGVETRYGLGFGDVEIFDAERAPTSQDGPGWWAARLAIERAKDMADTPGTAFVRTCFEAHEEVSVPELGGPAVEAFLIARDALIHDMSPRQRVLALGVLMGEKQEDLAGRVGVTQGAVSQNVRRSGVSAIAAAQLRLRSATR